MTIEASTAGHRNRKDAPTRAKVVINASNSEMNAPAVRYYHLKKLFLPFFLMANHSSSPSTTMSDSANGMPDSGTLM